MAEQTPKQLAQEKIEKMAKTLTGTEGNAFAIDDAAFYKQGKTFKELDGIRDLKLPAVLKKVVKNEKDEKPKTDGLTAPEKATFTQAEKLLKTATDYNKANEKTEDGKLKLAPVDKQVPFGRIIVAADGYQTMGKKEEADKLYTYAIKQAQALKNTAKDADLKATAGKLAKELEEYKDAVDVVNGKKKEMEFGKKKEGQGNGQQGQGNGNGGKDGGDDVSMSAPFDANVLAQLANPDSIQLTGTTSGLPAGLLNKVRSV